MTSLGLAAQVLQNSLKKKHDRNNQVLWNPNNHSIVRPPHKCDFFSYFQSMSITTDFLDSNLRMKTSSN